MQKMSELVEKMNNNTPINIEETRKPAWEKISYAGFLTEKNYYHQKSARKRYSRRERAEKTEKIEQKICPQVIQQAGKGRETGWRLVT